MPEQPLQIGWASGSITPDRPVLLEGQIYARISNSVRDPLTATVLVLDNGETRFCMVSLDMAYIRAHQCDRIRRAVRNVVGEIPITFSCIHTHNASGYTFEGFRTQFARYFGEERLPALKAPEDLLTGEEAEAFLTGRVASLIQQAWESRAPGGVSSASEYAAVGFNRRPVFQTEQRETSVMYGVCAQENFRRFEGGTDPIVNTLFTWDRNHKLTGMAVGVPCPSQVMELHTFQSADFWTDARRQIRDRLGERLYVLPLCEAAGDQNPLDLVRISKHNARELREWGAQAGEVWLNLDLDAECAAIGDRIADAVARALPRAQGITDSPVLRESAEILRLPIRLVGDAEIETAETQIAQARAAHDREQPLTNAELVRLYDEIGVLDRAALQRETCEYRHKIRFLRVGNAVLCFNPFELFVEYSLRVRAESRCDFLFAVQLTDDYAGYLPTAAAVRGGSYSSKPASTLVGPPGGEQLVRSLIDHVDRLMK